MQTKPDRNTTALAALRIFVGIFFLLFGEWKVFGTDFTLHGGFEEWIRGFLAQGTFPWMAPVLQHLVLPHARFCAFLTAYGELLIGLALVLGVLTRVASVFGILMMLLLWLSAGYPGPHVALWRYFGASLEWSVFAGCFSAFLIGEPEARWSLASLLCGRRKPLPADGAPFST
jgi:thiosulfate dehydrogenase [quinone] large subunit